MKYPRTFVVFGKTWTIRQIPNLNATGADGLTLKEEREVWLDSSIKDKGVLQQVFFHEFIHVIFTESGLDQTSVKGDLEEIVCEQVSQVFCDTFNLEFKTKKPRSK